MTLARCLVPLALLAASCLPSHSGPALRDLSGVWSGRWSDNAGGWGLLTLSVEQDGEEVSGFADLDGFFEWHGGHIDATIKGDKFSGRFVDVNGEPIIAFDAFVDHGHFEGTWDMLDDPREGILSAERASEPENSMTPPGVPVHLLRITPGQTAEIIGEGLWFRPADAVESQ